MAEGADWSFMHQKGGVPRANTEGFWVPSRHSETVLQTMPCVPSQSCQESLRYVSLILQTVAKTFKMLPVMLVGILISKKRHSLTEVVVVACLTLGLCLFVAGGDVRVWAALSESGPLTPWVG